jgi:beta-N-acetylhexosaminidase
MRRYASILILLTALAQTGSGNAAYAQGSDPAVEAILTQMSPEQRVGQLFLVTFYGPEAGAGSDIVTLIQDYHVGGVVLLAENDNFSDDEDVLVQANQLIIDLQSWAAGEVPDSALNGAAESEEPPPVMEPYVPLFIGIDYESGAWPYTQILSDVTRLPANLAIGATWDPDMAQMVGEAAGAQLSALGFNLMLGPSADIVENPEPLVAGNLGARVFGGEPYWVSQMVTAYVRGAHEGSAGRLAVVPRHFPGYGGADREASVEVPTVRRSLDQLIQFDLKPFIAVTGSAADGGASADGLLIGHIRYLGFQGDNPRLATSPISLDNQALPVLLALEPISQWHSDGGLIISDSLGLGGVRRFYDPQGVIFPHRRIAQDAFLAGNDVMYLGNFGSSPQVDQTATIADTIEFFVRAYDEDPAFQERVDNAVRRIIRKKLALYGGGFDFDEIVPSSTAPATLQQRTEVNFSVAQKAVTLVSPDHTDLLSSPAEVERIVVLTDTRPVRQCSTCETQPLIDVEAFQRAVLRLYGPDANGLVDPANIQSYSLTQLLNLLEFGPQVVAEGEDTPEPDPLAIALDSADWVVFLSVGDDPQVPASDAVKRFLADPLVAPGTQIVVMAMGAPYYLDSTEISKLAAYYALYNYSPPFVDVAARALFRGIPLEGASPVSISGIDYEILEATSPDPDQIIGLSVSGSMITGEQPQTPSPEPVGRSDTLILTTTVIVDRNNNPVPDGTPVEFVLNYLNEGLRNTLPVTTVDGVAQTSLVLERAGELEITAVAGEATNSDTIRLFGSGDIEVVPLDIPATLTPTPTESPEEEAIAELLSTPTASPTPAAPLTEPNVEFGDLFLALLGLIGISSVVFAIGMSRRDVNYALVLSLPMIVFGLIGYNYYALLLPGAGGLGGVLGKARNAWAASIFTWFSSLVGLAMVLAALYGWKRLFDVPLGRRNRR